MFKHAVAAIRLNPATPAARGRWRRGAARGTATMMMIVLSIIVTGYIMVLSWAAGVQSQMTDNLVHVDANYYAAEAGAQRAVWYIKNNVAVTQPLIGTVNNCAYSVTWVAGSGTSQRITSVATLGNAVSTVEVTVTPPSVQVQAAMSIGTNLNLKNLNIIGNVIVGGTITFASGSGSITGNLIYGTAESGSSGVSGTTTQAAWQPLNWASLDTTLKTQAGYPAVASAPAGSNQVYNFNALSGTNKVIYVNGNVTNPTFVGSGTLYVNGTVSVSNDPGSANPVNIVATSDITTANNMSYHGSLYTEGNWNRGKINITGSIYVEGMDQSNNGNSTINGTFTTTPWFDTRTSSAASGGGSVVLSNYAGPQP
jgi:hypothetical protein